MSKYTVFYNTTSAMRAQMAEIPPEQAAAGTQEWMTWGERVGSNLVDMGSPLVNEGDADVQVSGYSVIDADSQEQLDGFLEGTRTPQRAGRSRPRSSWTSLAFEHQRWAPTRRGLSDPRLVGARRRALLNHPAGNNAAVTPRGWALFVILADDTRSTRC